MKKLAIVLLIVAAGCHRKVIVATAPTTPAKVDVNATGAATPTAALQQFLAAAKAQDVQALARIWGSPEGPIIATMDREQLEMRAVVLFCYLHHDSYTITRDLVASGGTRLVTAELKYKTVTRSADFTTIRGKPNNLWYVQTFEPTQLNEICVASKR